MARVPVDGQRHVALLASGVVAAHREAVEASLGDAHGVDERVDVVDATHRFRPLPRSQRSGLDPHVSDGPSSASLRG